MAEIRDHRPFLDTEHGPIHYYKDRRKVLPEAFDDEYFRHMQWAHLASGAAGGGMRWPNRRPHVLTAGMRRAQEALAGFLPLVDWLRFKRVNLNEEIRLSSPAVAGCASGDRRQAVAWLVRQDTIGADGRLRRDAPPVATRLLVPGLAPGRYRITAWDTFGGTVAGTVEAQADAGGLAFDVPPFVADLALAIRRS
jgi:mannan endo-1,4-beta-mannosidase